jgi:hypothetical protein
VREAHAGVGDPAQGAVLEDLPQGHGVAVGEPGQGHGERHARLAGRVDEGVAALDAGREELLGEHVLACGDDLAEDLVVHGGGGGVGDAVEVLAGQ